MIEYYVYHDGKTGHITEAKYFEERSYHLTEWAKRWVKIAAENHGEAGNVAYKLFEEGAFAEKNSEDFCSVYSEMVRRLAKSGRDIIADMTHLDAEKLHMAVGISGEAGELLDAVKKGAIYGKCYDRANIIEELGDLEFYMEGLRQAFEITRDETLSQNINKLSKRYVDGVYKNSDAINRGDKK